MLTVGLPLRDVGFLLATGLHSDDRRAAERCWDDYRYGLFQAPMITVFGALVAKPTEQGDRMFTVMAERAATAIVDLDAFSLL